MKNILSTALLSATLVAPVVYADSYDIAFHNDSDYEMVVEIYNYEIVPHESDSNLSVPKLTYLEDITLNPNQFFKYKYTNDGETGAYPVIGDVTIAATNEVHIFNKYIVKGESDKEYKDAICAIDAQGLYTERGLKPALIELSYSYDKNNNFSVFDCKTRATAWKGDK